MPKATWAAWAARADTVWRSRRIVGLVLAGTILAVGVLGGLVFLHGAAQLIAIYCPALIIFVPAAQWLVVRRRFGSELKEMRIALVPALVARCPDTTLLHLARFGSTQLAGDMKVLRAFATGESVVVRAVTE